MQTFSAYLQVYLHDPRDIPQMKDIGKAVLTGVHSLASVSVTRVC